MKILVVDDQYTNQYLLEKLLTGYGFEVILAKDGIDALEKVRVHFIDLIISDILLPRMDGFQLCKEIKLHPDFNHIPFIFYTAAYTDQKDYEFAEKLGANRFIIKPTDPEEFISIIREVIAEKPGFAEIKSRPMILKEDEYLSEHNRRLFYQLEKKLYELEKLNCELQESEERYRDIFENANDPIILFELTPDEKPGQIREINPSACKILGYERTELVGKELSVFMVTDMKEQWTEIIPLLFSSGHHIYEGEISGRSGVTPVEINMLLYKKNGTYLCLSICRDIARRRQEMEEHSRALRQINHNIHQMAIIGDEIRNPLSIILSTCEECRDVFCNQVILSAVWQIDEFLSRLDIGWVESDKVREFLIKHYGIVAD